MNDYLGDVDIDTAVVKEDNMGKDKPLTIGELYLILRKKLIIDEYGNISFDPDIEKQTFKISMPTSDMYGQYVGLSYDEKEGKFYLS